MAQTYDVFISYKAEEIAEATWVRSVLEENGLRCWMAPASIPGGSSYADEIEDAIKASRVFVLILSERAQASKWVKKELDMALNCEKVILPFMIENCQLQKAFNYYLTDVQRYHAFSGKSAAMQEMISRIRSIIGDSDRAMLFTEITDTADSIVRTAPKRGGHLIRSLVLGIAYLLGLSVPLFLMAVRIDFVLWMRVLYAIWILIGAWWILDQMETNPKIAAMCFGTLTEKELNEHPSVVFSKIASVFGKGAFLSNEKQAPFVSYYKLRLIEFGSWDGERLNYLKIEFRPGLERYDPSILYLHTLSHGSQAVKMLTRQGFVLSEAPSCISSATDYLTKGNLRICLYYRRRLLRRALHGAILYNCTENEMIKYFQGEWKDEA